MSMYTLSEQIPLKIIQFFLDHIAYHNFWRKQYSVALPEEILANQIWVLEV